MLGADHALDVRATPPEAAQTWLPVVHHTISNLKRYLMGTFHGVSKEYLQKYRDEFAFLFNRRWWEGQLPCRLVEAAAVHDPLPDKVRGFGYCTHANLR